MSRQKKIIISAAITGAIHTPSMSPNFPASPEQIARQAVDAAKAGAAVVHIHARQADGMPVGDFGTFRQILSEIKREVNVVIGITTGGANGMTTEEIIAKLTAASSVVHEQKIVMEDRKNVEH